MVRKLKNNILLLLCLMLIPLSAFGAAEKAGKVMLKIGRVHVLRGRSLNWARLRKGADVLVNDIIRTGKKSKVKIELKDDSMLYLSEESKFRIKAVKKKKRSFFRMFSGKMRAVVKKSTGKKSKFLIRTRTAVVGVRGTDFIVMIKDGVTKVVTFEGTVAVINALETIEGEVLVKQNYYTEVTRTLPPTDPIELSGFELGEIMRQSGLDEHRMEQDEREEGGSEDRGEREPGDEFGDGHPDDRGEYEPGEPGDDDFFDGEPPEFGDELGDDIEAPGGHIGDDDDGRLGLDDNNPEPDIEDTEFQIQEPPPPPPF